MSPITHFLASWTLADNTVDVARDRNLVTWAGVLPDLDALGVILDKGQALLGLGSSWHYGDYHHLLLHGLPGAILVPGVLAVRAVRRLRVFFFAFLAVHLHLLCDLVGSRGPTAADVWPIWYFAPISERPVLVWTGQWALNAWPNVLFTMGLLGYALWAAVVRGHSPVGAFSTRADARVVEVLRLRWQALRRVI
jgi:membrane-bound metal-dependent hydrolase YbcI (DUF457 family)